MVAHVAAADLDVEVDVAVAGYFPYYGPGGSSPSSTGMGPGSSASIVFETLPRHLDAIRLGDFLTLIMPNAGLEGAAPRVRILEITVRDGDPHADVVFQNIGIFDENTQAFTTASPSVPMSHNDQRIARAAARAIRKVSRFGRRVAK